jgi:hypothetical protein
MDGNGMKFYLGGDKSYANGMFNIQLTRDTTTVRNAHHFVYDAYFYYTNSNAPQGLEFNISQYIDGHSYQYGMQCNIRSGDGPHWDLSQPRDESKPVSESPRWYNTGISCPAPPTYKWNHVVMETERTSDNKIKFVSISLNGNKHYINKVVGNRPADSTWHAITTHFQMNGNSNMTDYSVWWDKFNVTIW